MGKVQNSQVVPKWHNLTEWSGKRDSNSRPSAWEADALPTELLPQSCCKGMVNFLYNTNFSEFYFAKFLFRKFNGHDGVHDYAHVPHGHVYHNWRHAHDADTQNCRFLLQ